MYGPHHGSILVFYLYITIFIIAGIIYLIRLLQNKRAMMQNKNLEEQFRTDTQAWPFKAWLKNASYYAQTPFGRKFLDKNASLPPRGSRWSYENLIRASDDYFTAEDLEVFHEAWKAMLLAEK